MKSRADFAAPRRTPPPPLAGLAVVLVLAASAAAQDVGRTLSHEVIVAAPIERVWAAWTDPQQIVQWMGVKKAEMDLRVGGSFRSSYRADGELDGPSSIEHEILALEPPRMLATRLRRGPEGFDVERFARTWWVLRLEPLEAGHTRVTETGFGWGEGEGWDELYAFFDQGNQWTLQQLDLYLGQSAPAGEASTPAPDARGAPSVPGTAAHERDSYRAHLAAAEASLRLFEADAAQSWLEGAPVSQRGWEWSWLAGRADQSVATWQAHDDVVFGLRLRRDGALVATASYDGTARVWDAHTGELRATFAGHQEGLWAAVFTPDGERLVTAAGDRTARVWDAESGAQLAELWRHETPVSCVDVSADGRRIAASAYRWQPDRKSLDGLVRLFDASTLQEVATLVGGNKPLALVRFRPDGERLAAACWNGFLYVWDVERTELILELSMLHDELYSAVDALAWSPDGRLLAAGAKNGWVRIFDAEDGALRHTLSGHDGALGGLAFSPDGELLASGGMDCTVRLWDPSSGAALAVLFGHRDAVRGMEFAPDGRLFTASDDGTVRLWDTQAAASSQSMEHDDAYTLSGAPDGRVATSSYWGTVRVWDPDARRQLLEFDVAATVDPADSGEKGPSVNVVAFDPEGERLATGNLFGDAAVYDARTGRELLALGRHPSGSSGVAWSPDGGRVAFCHYDDVARVWNASDGRLLWAGAPSGAAAQNNLGGLDFDATGRRLAVPWGEAARVLDAETGELLVALESLGARVSTVRFTPDGQRVLGSGGGGRVGCWEPVSGALLWSAADHAGASASRLALLPDGSRAASCGGGSIVLWDVASGSPLLRWSPHRAGLYDLAFSADGARLVTLGHDGRLLVHAAHGGPRVNP